jgi:hypothetical protein
VSSLGTGNKTVINKFWSIIIFATVMIIGVVTAAYLYNLEKHSLYFYSDSAPHSFLARSYVDSNRPGFFEHLGTVWLPLPQLLLLPFTLIDPLFRSGFAGLVVSLPLHATTCVILYKLISRHVANSYIPVIGAFLYAFNPNFLYLSLVSMTEAPFMFFFVASAYYLQRWIFDSSEYIHLKTSTDTFSAYITSLELKNLFKSGVFVSLATLCRYEAWILSILLVIIVLWNIINRNKSHHKLRRKNIIFTVIVFSVISFSGIIFWLSWNAYSFGDPFQFANDKVYSAAAQALHGNRSFFYLQPLNILSVYGTTLLYTFGPLTLVAGLLGFFFSTIFSKDKKNKSTLILLYLILVIPATFTIITMMIGIGEMNLSRWFNSRFLILLGPLIALLDCMFIAYIWNKIKNLTIKRRHIISISTVAGLFAFSIISSLSLVVTFSNATIEFSNNKLAHGTGQVLGSIYDGNGTILILTDAGDISKIVVDSGVPIKYFIRISDANLNSIIHDEPWLHTKYAVIKKKPTWDAIDSVKYWERNKDISSNLYTKVYENKKFKIYAANNK